MQPPRVAGYDARQALRRPPRHAASGRSASIQNEREVYKEGMTHNYNDMLAVAVGEARKGLAEGGIPIGAAIFDASGQLMGAGHNRRVQHGDPSMHGETDAFRNAGRQRSYRQLIMVTTLAPCWYCSGLVRQFGFGTVVGGRKPQLPGRTRLAALAGRESDRP